jgi:glycosyltransferase involved in cell wall biosynthesis/GT2 family glycosyltransferase
VRLTLLARAQAGPAAARNAGAAAASGELLAFTDDDCLPRRDWLRRLAERHVAQPGYGLGGRTVNALPDNSYATTSQLIIGVGYAQNNADRDDARFFASNNLAFPAAGFREVGGFDESFRTSEDRELCSRWVLGGRRLGYEPDAVVDHASPLTLGRFWRQHVAYGRGAFRYHAIQAQRGHPVGLEPSFYFSLAREALLRPPGRRIRTLALLGVWHVANSVGYGLEGLRPGRARTGATVLHVTWSGRIGGIERFLSTVTLAAARRGGRAHRVCFMDGRGPVGDRLVAADLARRLESGRRPGPVALARLAREVRRARRGVVHLHTHSLATNLVAFAAAPRATRVYSEHSPRALRKDRKFTLLYRLLRATRVRFVAPAPAVAEAIEGRGVPRERIAVVPHPLTVPARERAGGGPDRGGTIGLVARLEPQKRVDLFVDVLAELRRREVSCSGIVVGDGSERADLAARLDEAGLGDAIELVGEQEDVTPWLDRMDVFLITSESEPFGLTALEAMARGVPVVAMPCPGGLPDLVRAGGELLPDRSTAAAADALQRLLSSPEARAGLRYRGRALAERHAPGAVVARLEEVYAGGTSPSGSA